MSKIPQHVVAVMAALKFRDARPEALHDLNDDQWEQLLRRQMTNTLKERGFSRKKHLTRL